MINNIFYALNSSIFYFEVNDSNKLDMSIYFHIAPIIF